MSENHRKHPRQPMRIDVRLSYGDETTLPVQTRDISEGGMFIELDDASGFPMGELVQVVYKNPLNNDQDTHSDAIIVRVADDGIGIAFVEMDAF